MKYKFKRLEQFPEHVRGGCYAITDDGHTVFPEDVTMKLNQLEKILKDRASAHNSDYAKCYNCGQEFEIEKGLCKECLDFGDGCGA